jgi:hypothetical protein
VAAGSLNIGVRDNIGISRAVNLEGATQATLSYVWTIDDDSWEDAFLFIQVSDNGGIDWITLHTIDEHVDEGTYSSSYDISQYASSQTQVRLIVDGTGDGYFFLHNIQIAYETGVNTAPQLTLPGSLAVDEDTPLTIAGITIVDVDVDPYASDQALLLTLSVDHGTLTLGDTTGLTFSTGDGTGDATLVFTGSLHDLNAALATLSYQGLPDYHGPDQLTVTVNDQGHVGSGEALSDRARSL